MLHTTGLPLSGCDFGAVGFTGRFQSSAYSKLIRRLLAARLNTQPAIIPFGFRFFLTFRLTVVGRNSKNQAAASLVVVCDFLTCVKLTSMKSLAYIYSITLFISFSFASCHKSSDIKVSIAGKWSFDSIQTRFVNGSPQYETIYKSNVDYYDFRNDGKLYRLYHLNYDTIPYEVVTVDEKLYIKYGGVLTDSIKALTSNILLIMNPQGFGSKFFFSK
jgi:hypothetical protein